jgi:hypothetical protein
MPTRILFSGYASVHFLCFRPIYERLKRDPGVQVSLSGGFRHKSAGETTYEIEGFYDFPQVDPADVVPLDEVRRRDYDVLVNSHLSDSLFPRSAGRTVQIFHGVSFKNYMVRPKALKFDILCLPGPYHARLYREHGFISDTGPEVFMTGFAKDDPLVDGSLVRADLLARMGMDPAHPTLLFAPTGDRHNALELYGESVIESLAGGGPWNVLVKPHDHPKNRIGWFERLAPLESDRVRLVRDLDVVPYLHAADLLVSDASSVITEFTLLDRPIVLLHVPQLLDRVVARGGALDTSTYAHRIAPFVQDPSMLPGVVASQLDDSSDHAGFRRAMADDVFFEPGTASDRVAAVVRYAAGLADLPKGLERLAGQAGSTRAA